MSCYVESLRLVMPVLGVANKMERYVRPRVHLDMSRRSLTIHDAQVTMFTLCFFISNIYRMLQVPKDMTWEIKRYHDHTLHMINTDIDTALDIDDARREAEHKAVANSNSAPPADEAGAGGTEETEPAPPLESKPVAASPTAPAASSDSPATMDVDRDTVAPSAPVKSPLGRFHALCLHFTLPTAAYATMCLREITRQDTSTIFHTSLNTLPAGQHPSHSTAQAAAGGGDGAGGTCSSQSDQEDGRGGGAVLSSSTSSSTGSVAKGAVIKVGSSMKR